MHASVLARLEKKITRILEEPKKISICGFIIWPYFAFAVFEKCIQLGDSQLIFR